MVELKAVGRGHPAHKKQVLADLGRTGMKLGYWINFGESSDERWHHADHRRRVMSPSPWPVAPLPVAPLPVGL